MKTNQVTPASTNPARRGNISSGENTPKARGTALRKAEEAKSSWKMIAWSSPLAVLATPGAHRLRMSLFSCSALGQRPPGIPFGCCSTSSPLPTHLHPEQPLCPHHHLQPSLGRCSAPCMAQQGEEQPGGWGYHFGHLCPAQGPAAFPGAHPNPFPGCPAHAGSTKGAVPSVSI